ncbi:hypothetical protein WJX82_006433 [Trebouxia sp. C0006]
MARRNGRVESQRILLVCTSNPRLGDSDRETGVWAESLFSAYYFFTRKGYEVTLASVKGGKLPIDPKSVVTPYLTTVVKKGLTDDFIMARVNTTASIVYIDGAEFDGVYIVDGLGIMWDGVYNSEIIRVVQESLRAGKMVAAVGHGVAALCNVTDDRGNFIVAGKQMTGTTDTEEELLGAGGMVPFSIEAKLRKYGAVFRQGTSDTRPFATRSGSIVTGQNSASSLLTAEGLVEAMSLGVRMTVV